MARFAVLAPAFFGPIAAWSRAWSTRVLALLCLIGAALAAAVSRGLVAPGLGCGRLVVVLVLDLARAHAGLNPQVDPSFFRLVPELEAERLDDLDGPASSPTPSTRSPAFRRFLAERPPGLRLASFFTTRQLLAPYTNVIDGVRAPDDKDLTSFTPRPPDLRPEDYEPGRVAALVPWMREAGSVAGPEPRSPRTPDLRLRTTVPRAPAPSRHPPLRARAAGAARLRGVPGSLRAFPRGGARAPRSRDGFDPAHDVALEGAAPRPVPRGRGRRLLDEEPGEGRYRVKSDGEGWLVVRENIAAGWRATVDGQAGPGAPGRRQASGGGGARGRARGRDALPRPGPAGRGLAQRSFRARDRSSFSVARLLAEGERVWLSDCSSPLVPSSVPRVPGVPRRARSEGGPDVADAAAAARGAARFYPDDGRHPPSQRGDGPGRRATTPTTSRRCRGWRNRTSGSCTGARSSSTPCASASPTWGSRPLFDVGCGSGASSPVLGTRRSRGRRGLRRLSRRPGASRGVGSDAPLVLVDEGRSPPLAPGHALSDSSTCSSIIDDDRGTLRSLSRPSSPGASWCSPCPPIPSSSTRWTRWPTTAAAIAARAPREARGRRLRGASTAPLHGPPGSPARGGPRASAASCPAGLTDARGAATPSSSVVPALEPRAPRAPSVRGRCSAASGLPSAPRSSRWRDGRTGEPEATQPDSSSVPRASS